MFELPLHLRERTRILHTGQTDSQGDCVVYWMRTALRARENPALDVACQIAQQLDLPLLVYQGLSADYEFASDRHHRFILEGACDVQRQFNDLPIAYAFYLETRDQRRKVLLELASDAACIVTEDMPTQPCPRFTNALAQQADVRIIGVETACVVPPQLVGQPYLRAFEFRDATKQLYAERVSKSWPSIDRFPSPLPLDNLPFTPVDLQAESLSDLIASCPIDHGVGPIPDTEGGSTAGYRRWEEFKEQRLASYAKQRNDAAGDGVSRLSAYLHYGMVSPFRIAREANDAANKGAVKYLDELLIWRELAYTYCHFISKHESYEELPSWARATLDKHREDPRPALLPYERLMRAQTGDRLWDAGQVSLLRQGELHNNIRMTWGKAILNWTDDPKEALRWIIDLNHRFALDGCDPASYGGILWCLGQFDRPFSPEQPVLGRVRSRSTTSHAKRLDLERYEMKVATPRYSETPRVAVVGAGLSGAVVARQLADHGCQVSIFEKSRGVGGRMATRRIEELRFDHGAQYFTARDPEFIRHVQMWKEAGIVAPWQGLIKVLSPSKPTRDAETSERFVACPAMNSLCKHLIGDLSIKTGTRIQQLESVENGPFGKRHSLVDTEGNRYESFDYVVVTTPAPQASELLQDASTISQTIAEIPMSPCWAAMIELPRALEVDWSGAFINDSLLSWAARGATRPQRDTNTETLVLHASAEWTREHLDLEHEQVGKLMLSACWEATQLPAEEPTSIAVHRWLYARPEKLHDALCFFDPSTNIVACGDWACDARVEGAFLSGQAAVGRVLNSLVDRTRADKNEKSRADSE